MGILISAGASLLSLALAAWHISAVETCVDLISAVEAIATSGTVSVDADFSCVAQVTVAASQTVTITGPATISIGNGFAADSSSLFVNDGTLNLQDIYVTSEVALGNRAVWNTGSLSVDGCSFTALNGNGAISTILDQGGAIYSLSSGSVDITSSTFTSNVVSSRGGAISAGNAETLTITGCTFSANEATAVGEDAAAAAGGDVWADDDVELTVTNSVFTGSSTDYGGAAIECCGGVFTNTNFSNTDSAWTTAHYGAVLVGRPGVGCPRVLEMTGCVFDGCTVNQGVGAGGSLAIFDTSATIEECTFQNSAGTALLFSSSSADGNHKLDMVSNEFNLNTLPSDLYQSETSQGSAVVITNTGVEGAETVEMGSFHDILCYANDPYECEFIGDMAEFAYTGDFKCQVCNSDGVRQLDTREDDDLAWVGSTDEYDDSSSDSWSSRDYVIMGLTGAAALAVLVGVAIFVCLLCRKRASSGTAQSAEQPPAAVVPPAEPTGPPAIEACPPPATTGSEVPGSTAPSATAGTV